MRKGEKNQTQGTHDHGSPLQLTNLFSFVQIYAETEQTIKEKFFTQKN